jgi:CRP-like cAMP-binding protein
MDAAAALKASSLFKGFTDTGLQIVASICVRHNYPQGSPLFVENMVSDAMLIIADGKVSLTVKGKSNEELPVGEVGAGDWLGELALINTGQRMCTATAASAVTAFEIRQADFQKLMANKPQACIKLLMGIVGAVGQKVVDNREALKSLVAKP